MCKQPYESIMEMPILRFRKLLKWKYNLEKEKQKVIDEKNKL